MRRQVARLLWWPRAAALEVFHWLMVAELDLRGQGATGWLPNRAYEWVLEPLSDPPTWLAQRVYPGDCWAP